MQHVISPAEVTSFVAAQQRTTTKKAQVNVFSKFINWCEGQEENKMLWLVLSYLGQIGMALPCTLAAILFLGGNNFTLWIIACVINVPVLAINLAAQPTKITIPTLLFAWTVDVSIILYCASLFYFNF
jgi:hypothetical protein